MHRAWQTTLRVVRAIGAAAERASKRGHGACFLWGLVVAALWTTLGACVAAFQGTSGQFLREWLLLQGPPLIGIGTWLVLIARSTSLRDRITGATRDGAVPDAGIDSRSIRHAIVGSIGVLGTASLISLGFSGRGVVLAFFWLTCACVCFAAAVITLHAIDMILLVRRLQDLEIKVFRYAPARTQELKDVVNYFTAFTLLTTIGYGFALVATLLPNWTGHKDYIAMVRLFWPILYVPGCTFALIYPHYVMHSIIQREKERTLLLYHREIDELLVKYGSLTGTEIDRTNTLAQLFDRISATPDYVVDLGIAARTVVPLLFNLATFFARAYVKPS